MNQNPKPRDQYPAYAMIPKQDNQATSFLRKYPEYDGRGTTIAILDTGIDPGAKGMQTTTDGKPKIIDIVDCTGAGDVVMKKVVKAIVIKHNSGEESMVLHGLSGRTLIIDPSWTCPSGDYRVGIKPANELFPKKLVERVGPVRRQVVQLKNGHLLDKTKKMLCDFDEKNPSLSEDALLQRDDLEAQIETLKELEKSYTDPGSIYDCVVFHDGTNWRAVIDADESGDLRGQPCLTDYRKELQYHTFGKLYDLNFSVNIYEEGDILSIVTDSGGHGTHVAGITAANFPDEPLLNGIAPGAQLVSLRVLDPRGEAREEGLPLTRAASYLATHSIDLSNLSCGESSCLPTGGHFINLMSEEVISKSGCIFFTSAGNSGPGLSTITAPGGTHMSFVTVGAYVHQSQMEAAYALLESVPESPFSFSSRGPCTDGDSGVDIYAPGNAISPIPTYSLTGFVQKNGTSMASPNACGCAALLVSGLKAEKIKYTPFRIKAAVVQSAKDVNDPLGVGFIQVEEAWKYLTAHKDRYDLDMQFMVRVNKQGICRGIYLREREETIHIQNLNVQVNPTFPAERDAENPQYNNAKRDCDVRATLKATQPWIMAPKFVRFGFSGNKFGVQIDPTNLENGQFYYGEIVGYDSVDNVANTSISRGPLFRVPVYVAKPAPTCNGLKEFTDIKYSPGHIGRYFVHVPEGASYCELTIRCKPHTNTGPAKFMLHTLQIVPQCNQNKRFKEKFFIGEGTQADPTSGNQVIKKCFAVRGGLNMELCFAQDWFARGEHTIDLSLEFHGVQIAGNLANGNGIAHLDHEVTRMEIIAPIRREENVYVSISFDTLRKYIRPFKAQISPMHPERNTLPNTKLLHSLALSYKFGLDTKSSIIINFPTVMDKLYEHFLASIFGILYDANGKTIGYMDMYYSKFILDMAGEHTLMLYLITEEPKVLEKLKTTLCEIDLSINRVQFSTYKTMRDVYCSKQSNFTKIQLERNELTVFHVANSELPKEARPGDALVGSLLFTDRKIKNSPYQVVYTVPPFPAEEGKPKVDWKSDDEETDMNLKNALMELQIKHLKKFSPSSTQYESVYKNLSSNSAEDPTFLSYKIETLWKASKDKNPTECMLNESLKEAQAKEIIKFSETILNIINQNELFIFFGRQKPKNESKKEKAIRKQKEKQKNIIIQALKNKLMALAATGQPLPTEFENNFRTLQEFYLNESDQDLAFLLLSVQREIKAEPPRFGLALKLVQNFLKNASLTPDTAKDLVKAWKVRSQLYEDLGWDVWVKYEANSSVIRQPPSNKPSF